MDEHRPDPDVLLEQMRMETERKREGHLKIFFGAAPGVGKTYAMLEAARHKLSEGADVLVGLVETHNRKETEALLDGLEILPRRRIEYRGAVLKEFDIDAALSRKPSIILVDELAHTNAEGSRHKKRWQDIYELLGAGITVYTTMNVQHLESLNDVVAQITGINVRETVPDFLLDRADEIELIDLPPDDLLQRLAEGKVYVAELAVQARKNFFRKGNLLALRELALRRTAEQVDEQMQSYRLGKGVKDVWPAAERILVCIGPSPFATRLIRAAKRVSAGLRADWIAVNVEAPGRVRPTEHDIKGLAENIRLAESLGAETVVLSGHKASEEILNYARSRNVTKIIIGKPTHPRWKDKIFGSMLDEIVRGSGEIEVYVISGDKTAPAPERQKPVRLRTPAKEWATSALVVALCTGVGFLMRPAFTIVDIAMVYILGVVFIASRTGNAPSMLASFLSVAAFDFFFVPPYYTFAVSDVKYIVTFVVMFVVAAVISKLTLRIRSQAEAARIRERSTASLYRLSRDLVHERSIDRLREIATKHIAEVSSGRAAVFLPDAQDKLSPPTTDSHLFMLDGRELSVAQWAFDHRQKAGCGTDTLPGARGLYIPLVASSRTIGVIGLIADEETEALNPEQIHVLENFAHQIAMAFERAFLAEETQQALLKAETESLRNTLLSSLSHDLRTPLAAITGSSTTLLKQDDLLDRHDRRELVFTIIEEAEHLNRLVRNVLDMTRIESGAITVKKEWLPFEEIVGSVLGRLADKLANHSFAVQIPSDLPLAPFDPLLIEQVLMNLLENAVRYTPAGTVIELSAKVKEDELLVELADYGPGITPGDEERIFDKFVRGPSASGGIGLGLTICRAIINAHGGRIWAENREGGGVYFRFTIPILEHPPIVETDEETVRFKS
ncbi:MAG TPA: sensor histidine kinase KdpD [Dissulfurispiraceae bacterium]|nr:sensor histidine kinase KdpD [Dissulfurispiraceae bacterium]